MARKKSIHVSALNIKLLEHSTQIYIDLLQFIKRQRLAVRYHGERHAMIGFLNEREEGKPGKGLHGMIFSFVELDPNDPWLNVRTGKAAEEADLNRVQVPEHLKPGMRTFSFAFFPEHHRLFFERRNEKGEMLGPSAAQRIFERFGKHPATLEQFGDLDVTVEPQLEALDLIFKMPRMDKLTIHVTRPNPDDHEDEERRIMERLQRQNARSHTQELKSVSGETLEPDDDSRILAKVAASNGFVEAKGRDEEGKPLSESTKEHPLKEIAYYDPDTQAHADTLWMKALEMLRIIKRK